MIKHASILALLTVLLFSGCTPKVEEYPSNPITVIVPWAAGGGTDTIARAFADKASDVFGVMWTVNNKTGGLGISGHDFGAKARPNGYTLTLITYELCTYKALNRADLGPEDFKAIMQINADPGAITVQADSQWSTLQDMIDYAKENPKDIKVGNSGPGSVWHIGAAMLEKKTGAKFTHVPHDGAAPAVVELLGGHIDAVAVSPAEVRQHVKVGRLKILAIMSEEPFPEFPDVPTMKKAGIDLVHETWRGLAAPKDTPDEIIETLETGGKKVYESPEFQQAAEKANLGLRYRNSEEFQTFLQKQQETAQKVIETAGILPK